MRTHPDIGLVKTHLLQPARFWLCSFLRQTSNGGGIFKLLNLSSVFGLGNYSLVEEPLITERKTS